MAMLLHLLHFQDSLDPCEKQMFQVFRYKTLEKKVFDTPCNNLAKPKKLSFPSLCLIQSCRMVWTGIE
ncbi:hypothetical protein YC2023_005516 [Brassica napus]